MNFLLEPWAIHIKMDHRRPYAMPVVDSKQVVLVLDLAMVNTIIYIRIRL
jgi:hypothetical protein